jgi:hypothetical protein
MGLPKAYFLHLHFLPDFLYEKPNSHDLLRRCPASWKYGNVLEPRFSKGLTAAKSGDFSTALWEWTPLAKQGYSFASSIWV